MASNRLTYQDWIVEISRDPGQPTPSGWSYETTDPFATGEPDEVSRRLDYIRDQVQRAMNGLSESEQRFLVDFYFMGESYESMSSRQGRAVYKLEALHGRALRKLRRSLAGLVWSEYGISSDRHRRCPICSSKHRAEIERLIGARVEEQPWGPVMKRLREEFGLNIKSPQVIIGHLKYHETSYK